MWDTSAGACLATLPHAHIVRSADISTSGPTPPTTSTPDPPSSPRLSPASLRILTGGHEKRLRLWDLSRAPMDGKDVGTTAADGVYEFRRGVSREKTAHDGTIKKVLFDEARQSCVSMGEDRMIRCVRMTRETVAADVLTPPHI